MIKQSFSLHKAVLPFMLVAAVALLSACNKHLGDSTPVPASGVMVFNLAPDREAVGVALSGNPLSSTPLTYTSFNGLYQNVYAGQRDVQAYDYWRDSVFSASSFNFQDGSLYSLFVVGNGGTYRNVIVKDEVDSSASADKAYVRYINAVADSSAPVISVTAGGSHVSGNAAAFAHVSDFMAVPAGSLTIAASNGGSIVADRTLQVENGKIYTALLVGVPNATDSASKVQIRYVINGTVSSGNSGK